jgi:hypothetical protein
MWIGFLLNESEKDGSVTESANAEVVSESNKGIEAALTNREIISPVVQNSGDAEAKVDKEPEPTRGKLFGIF